MAISIDQTYFGSPPTDSYKPKKSDIVALLKDIESRAAGVVSVAKYGAVGTGDETTEINAAITANSMVYMPPGNYTTTGLSEADLMKLWGFGLLTNSGSLETSNFTMPGGVYIKSGARDGSADDIVNLPTQNGALEIHTRKASSAVGSILIYNKGNFAAGTSATSLFVGHHYTDAPAFQIDNTGINVAVILKASRNDTKRPDKGANWVATGAFMVFSRAGSGVSGASDELASSLTTFQRNGSIKFEDDPAQRSGYRTIEATGQQRLKLKSVGGHLWLESGSAATDKIYCLGPVWLGNQAATGRTASDMSGCLNRQGSDLYYSDGTTNKKVAFV